MIRILILFIIISFSHSQYVLNKGFYLNSSISGSGNYLFETSGFDTENESAITYKGSGYLFNFGLTYAMNSRNMLEFSYGIQNSVIRHQSVLYDKAAETKRLSSTRNFSELSSTYSYIYRQYNIVFGGGTKVYFPESKYNDYDLSVYGELHIGMIYQYNMVQFAPIVSYAFPISNLNKKGTDLIRLGNLNFGIKLWFKVL